MGLGYWLTEECKYDPTTGALVTNSTWVNFYLAPLHKKQCIFEGTQILMLHLVQESNGIIGQAWSHYGLFKYH